MIRRFGEQLCFFYNKNLFHCQETEISEEGTSISEEDATLLSEQEVIGIIEIEALNLKYPIVEGADSKSIAYAIVICQKRQALEKKGIVSYVVIMAAEMGILYKSESDIHR